MGNRCRRANQPLFDKRSPVYLSNNRLLFKVGEAIPLVEVKTSYVVNFIKHHVIHRFGVLRLIIHDNVPQFVSQVFYRFPDKYQIQNMASTAYNPATNGLAEAFNKIIIKLLKNLFHQISEAGMRSLVNVFRPTEPQFGPRQTIHLFPWYTGAKQSYIRNPDAVITSRFDG